MRISTKNAGRIRRGVVSGRETIKRVKARGAFHLPLIEDNLERRAWNRTMTREVNRLSVQAQINYDAFMKSVDSIGGGV